MQFAATQHARASDGLALAYGIAPGGGAAHRIASHRIM